jgi:hypothetical protein
MNTTTTMAIALAASLLAGCLSTQTMPIAPNQVRIDTQAGGLLFTGQTVPATMKAAATATLQAGFTHFRLSNVSSGQGSVSNPVCTWDRNGGGCTDIGSPVAAVGAIVTMFRAGDQGAAGAFDARQVLTRYGG